MKFTPEQFKEVVDWETAYSCAGDVATKAQALFDAWLEAQPVVYAYVVPEKGNAFFKMATTWSWTLDVAGPTHRARLVAIEQIEKKAERTLEEELSQHYACYGYEKQHYVKEILERHLKIKLKPFGEEA